LSGLDVNIYLGARQISSGARFCRINAAFQLPSERRIYAAGKISVVRPIYFAARHFRGTRGFFAAA
jgi:hypothetical protein